MTLSSVHQVRSYQINIFFRILGQRANSCHPRPNRRLSDCRACLYRTFYGGFKIGWSGSWLKDHSRAPVSVLVTHFKKMRLGYVENNPQSSHFWSKVGFCPTGEVKELAGKNIVLTEYDLE